MKEFRFSLERALQWRRQQVEIHRGQLQLFLGKLDHLDKEVHSLNDQRRASRAQLQEHLLIASDELSNLASFERFVQARHLQIEQLKRALLLQIQQQQLIMVESERNVKMLENLRSRQLTVWTAQRDRALEDLAYESFLSRRARGRRPDLRVRA